MIFVCFTLIASSALAFAPLGIETVPATAGGTAPEELLRLETATAALVAHHALAVRRHQAFLHLQQLAHFRLGVDQLGVEQAIERAQAGIAPQLLACKLAGRSRTFGFGYRQVKGIEHILRRLPR